MIHLEIKTDVTIAESDDERCYFRASFGVPRSMTASMVAAELQSVVAKYADPLDQQ